jgi:hypothetical protein
MTTTQVRKDLFLSVINGNGVLSLQSVIGLFGLFEYFKKTGKAWINNSKLFLGIFRYSSAMPKPHMGLSQCLSWKKLFVDTSLVIYLQICNCLKWITTVLHCTEGHSPHYGLWANLAFHLFLQIKFYWNSAIPIHFCNCLTVLELLWQNWVSVTETKWITKPYLALYRKFVNYCCKRMLGNLWSDRVILPCGIYALY